MADKKVTPKQHAEILQKKVDELTRQAKDAANKVNRLKAHLHEAADDLIIKQQMLYNATTENYNYMIKISQALMNKMSEENRSLKSKISSSSSSQTS